MKITVLAENTAISEDFGSEHGLSILIQMKDSTILFDTGAAGCSCKTRRNWAWT